MSVDGGARTKLTTMTGASSGEISPDNSTLGVIYSASNRPPEVFVMPNKAGAPAAQVTTSTSEEWRSFKWVEPQLVTYKTRDGVDVYARVFTPEMVGAKRHPAAPAVVFVHGAGYLQNAHKYWSTLLPRGTCSITCSRRKATSFSIRTIAPAPATAATGAPRSTAGWAARISRTSWTARSFSWTRRR